MTFRSSILAGVTLIRQAIQSPNYSKGKTGWSVNQDGSAEFNDVTIRNGETVGNTSLYYNGTPAAGNLIGSISEAAGTDQYGNPYLAGFCVYNPGAYFVQMNGATVFMGTMNGNTPDTTDQGYIGMEPGGALLIQGPTFPPSNTVGAQLEMVPGSPGITKPGASEPYLQIWDPTVSSVVSVTVSGAVIKSNLGTPVAWQTPTLNSGWVSGPAGGSYQGLRYRLDAEDNLVLAGVVHCTAGSPPATLFTLPSGYIPKSGQRPAIASNAAGTYAARSLEISAAGAVTVDPVPTAACDLYIYATIPLGNIS